MLEDLKELGELIEHEELKELWKNRITNVRRTHRTCITNFRRSNRTLKTNVRRSN